MAAEHRPKLMTVEEYFALERSGSDVCYEYVDGYVYMMAGGSLNHDAIKTNIQGLLWAFLRGKSCRAYSSDAKVQVNKQRYFHPDVTVTCDPGDQGTIDVIKYPRVVFEVLSPGTQIKDRTWKMQNYLALPSLEEYILVDSHTIKMEMYRREAGKWVYYVFGPEDQLELASIDFNFPVVEAYLGVNLEKVASEAHDEEYGNEEPS
jgi:Uma2 family endonuclease